jgi:potassium-transporting ATPase KdpC subunit
MLTYLRRSVIFGLLLIVFTFAYAFLGTGLSQLFFNHQANGSITKEGSTLIGQNWASNKWFHGRPDDTGPYAADPKKDISGGDNPLEANGVSGESGATNLGPRSKVLLADTKQLVAYWHARGVDPTPDLVTTSGSGYDPDISPEDAIVQIPMVSRATGISPSRLRALINQETNGPELGFLGASYIDVLQLNEALAKMR